MRFLILFALLISFANVAFADCPEQSVTSGIIQVLRGWNTQRNACEITLTPRNKATQPQYRSYKFDSTGLFTVMNTYGRGQPKINLGLREFFILPLLNYEPTFKIEANRDVTVTLVSGHQFKISSRDFTVTELTPGIVLEKPLARDNGGGFEFILKEGFWFDSGFKIGVAPLVYPMATSLLKSSKSTVSSCRLNNQEFLAYKQEHYIIGYDIESLMELLKFKCPQLKL
jgi:hypothetical protein